MKPTDESVGPSGGGTLRIIASFKVAEALILVFAGLGALGMLDPAMHRTAIEWLESLSLHEGRHLSSAIADKAATLLLNVLVLVYLIVRLVKQRHEAKAR